MVLGLDELGVAVVGPLPSALPQLSLPDLSPDAVATMLAPALGIAVVAYSDNVLTARAFAERSDQQIDANQEFLALGVANIAGGLLSGFPVSSSGSRTAIGSSMGSRTQMYSLATLATVLVAVLALGPVIAAFPKAALGALVVYAAIRLVDVAEIRRVARFRRSELVLLVATTLGVFVFGALYGILLAVALSLGDLLRRVARPHDGILGYVRGLRQHQEPVQDRSRHGRKDAHPDAQPDAAQQGHRLFEAQCPGVPQESPRTPHLVLEGRRGVASQDDPRPFLVFHDLTDQSPQMIQELRRRLAEGGLIGELEEVAEGFAPLTGEATMREPHLPQSMQHLRGFPGHHKGRDVHQYRRAEAGTDVGRTARKIAELGVEGEGKSPPQIGFCPRRIGMCGRQREAGPEGLNAEVILLIQHHRGGRPEQQTGPRTDPSGGVQPGQFTGDQLPLMQQDPLALAQAVHPDHSGPGEPRRLAGGRLDHPDHTFAVQRRIPTPERPSSQVPSQAHPGGNDQGAVRPGRVQPGERPIMVEPVGGHSATSRSCRSRSRSSAASSKRSAATAAASTASNRATCCSAVRAPAATADCPGASPTWRVAPCTRRSSSRRGRSKVSQQVGHPNRPDAWKSLRVASHAGQWTSGAAAAASMAPPLPMAARNAPSGVSSTSESVATPRSAAHRLQRWSVRTSPPSACVRWTTASRW
jgi:hypothetical protein